MEQPSSDRPLDEQTVSGLVAAQFPDLSGQPVTRLGAGWDNELFAVGGEWVLRFPRRAERVPWLGRCQRHRPAARSGSSTTTSAPIT